MERSKHTCELIRVNGKLVEMTTVRDEDGGVLHRMLKPSSLEIYVHDFMQILVGATLLAVPIGFTQETWELGAELTTANVLGIMALSVAFMSMFIYYTSYRGAHFRSHVGEFIKRLIVTYALSFIVAAVLLLMIDKAPWTTDHLLAFKRAVIVAFPASLSAAVADTIKQ